MAALLVEVIMDRDLTGYWIDCNEETSGLRHHEAWLLSGHIKQSSSLKQDLLA